MPILLALQAVQWKAEATEEYRGVLCRLFQVFE